MKVVWPSYEEIETIRYTKLQKKFQSITDGSVGHEGREIVLS